ncbi:Uncharacterized mitochondrial protein AtMg00860, partial [Striga hermonthica]
QPVIHKKFSSLFEAKEALAQFKASYAGKAQSPAIPAQKQMPILGKIPSRRPLTIGSIQSKQQKEEMTKLTKNIFDHEFKFVVNYTDEDKQTSIYPVDGSYLGPKAIALPEADPMKVYMMFQSGLLSCIYFRDAHMFQYFPINIKKAISQYGKHVLGKKEGFIKIFATTPIFGEGEKSQEVIQPAIQFCQIGISNGNYPDIGQAQHEDELIQFLNNYVIILNKGIKIKGRINYAAKSIIIWSMQARDPAEIDIKLLNKYLDTLIKIQFDIPETIKKEICIRLQKEFTEDHIWIEARVIEHRLNIDLSVRPVKQKRRHHGAEMDKIIEQKVDKLLNAGHIKKIQFPEWLSNTVMVSKLGGKWRMFIDFRDLNKACPKDLYPLPRIDQLVDSTAGCELLSLMDASQGYHQIPLAKEDWKRVSFITSKGTYCYVFMPFRLKNAGATYQRLVDQIFKDQLGRNMEVYVDDMLVKSKKEDDHAADLRETFQTLRRFGMKLNPAKCSFGVKSGKLLGYMVTKQGIEVNPEKVKAVIEMKPPANVKEVQILTGRIAGLSRFISKVAEKSSPLFKTLKKSSKFQWTEKAQKAFEELQRTLANLPLLAKPIHGEELVLYISVGESAVSPVLLREEEVTQFPIYYVSRVMQGAELRYSEIEKCALMVVVTVRKLRPYFLNHKVKVRTNMPLEQTLGRPAVSGRLIKWAVELSEYSIKYEPRRAIKGQVLADFIQEGTKEEEDGGGMW